MRNVTSFFRLNRRQLQHNESICNKFTNFCFPIKNKTPTQAFLNLEKLENLKA